MNRGKVKWWHEGKGFGIIETQHGDVFVTAEELNLDNDKNLEPGQNVVLELVDGHRGLSAINVSLEQV
jgi:CspA family cold shock protein